MSRVETPRAAVCQELVQVGAHAEPVAVVIRRQVVAAIAQGFEGQLGVGDVLVGLGDGQSDLGDGRLILRGPAVGLEQDRRGDFQMEPCLLDRVLGFVVESQGMGVLLARDVSRHRAFKVVVAELLEEGGPEVGIIEGSGPEPDQGIAMGTLEALDVGLRDPEGQQPEHGLAFSETEGGSATFARRPRARPGERG